MSTREAAQENPEGGWGRNAAQPSLPEVFRSIHVPKNAGWLRRLLAFVGPGYLIAVGYMDPGNWASDISGGASFNYALLSVVLLSNLAAVFLQALSVKLGIATGRDLAQACRDTYRRPVAIALWLSAEVAIIACDIAEVIGAGIALNLLFHIPLFAGCLITSFDVLLVLALQGKGFRRIEALVIALVAVIIGILVVEVGFAHPDWHAMLLGAVPSAEIIRNPAMLYVALSILGATVMPHNLYLHSSIVQTRKYGEGNGDRWHAIKSAWVDSTVALTFALVANAALLVLSAAVFFHNGHHQVGDIQTAYKLLTPLVGVGLATPLFAVALLASGQNSTLTGTMAGQIILEGFTDLRLPAWARRLISRLLAIVPTLIVVALCGNKGTVNLLIFSQVILSMQLSMAVIPLVQLTSDRKKMGEFVNRASTKVIGWFVAAAILVLNLYLVYTQIGGHH